MNGRFSNYQVSKWMEDLAAQDLFLALFTSDPLTVSNPLTVEMTGTSVAREPMSWSRTSPYSLELANDVFFSAIPPETSIVAVGGFDAPLNGRLIFRDLISTDGKKSTPLYFATGGTFGISAGELVVGMDIPA